MTLSATTLVPVFNPGHATAAFSSAVQASTTAVQPSSSATQPSSSAVQDDLAADDLYETDGNIKHIFFII